MKIKDFKESNLREFTKICLQNNHKNCYEYTMKCIRKAKNIVEFKDIYFKNADEEIKLSQGYAELSKESYDHWYRIRDMFSKSTKFLKVSSECGGVSIGNENFTTVVPNGYGDGITRVGIYCCSEIRNFNSCMMNYNQIYRGTFNVYACDYSQELILATLKGTWCAYWYDGFVAFVGNKDSEIILNEVNDEDLNDAYE